MPPTLRTDRLVLTPSAVGDLDDMVALWTDPAVYEIILGARPTREQVWHRLLRYIGQWPAVGYGHWTVRTGEGAFVGSVGIMDSRRDTSPSFEGVPELGWTMIGSAHGRGYGREAVEAVLAWADAAGIDRTVCIIVPENAVSIRLAGRLGYRCYAEGTYGTKPTLFFERVAGDPPRPQISASSASLPTSAGGNSASPLASPPRSTGASPASR